MKLPLRIKETLYHDSETGKPIGSEYWIFDDGAEELFVINDDEEAARRIVACVNACEGLDLYFLENANIRSQINDAIKERNKAYNALMEANAEIENLRHQNAELVEALRMARSIIISESEYYLEELDIIEKLLENNLTPALTKHPAPDQ